MFGTAARILFSPVFVYQTCSISIWLQLLTRSDVSVDNYFNRRLVRIWIGNNAYFYYYCRDNRYFIVPALSKRG